MSMPACSCSLQRERAPRRACPRRARRRSSRQAAHSFCGSASQAGFGRLPAIVVRSMAAIVSSAALGGDCAELIACDKRISGRADQKNKSARRTGAPGALPTPSAARSRRPAATGLAEYTRAHWLDVSARGLILGCETSLSINFHLVKQLPAAEEKTPRSTHRSLERGFMILEAVAACAAPMSLAEASRRTGLHRSTAFHLLQTLVGLGFLRRVEATRRYELATRLHRLTQQKWTFGQLSEAAAPVLAQLAKRSGEGAALAAFRGATLTVVAKHKSDAPVRVMQEVGTPRPPHASAAGKVSSPGWPPRNAPTGWRGWNSPG